MFKNIYIFSQFSYIFFRFLAGNRQPSDQTMKGLLMSTGNSPPNSLGAAHSGPTNNAHLNAMHSGQIHHRHTLSEDSNDSSILMASQPAPPPPPTLSRLPPDGHEFPPDYRDPASNIVYQVLIDFKLFIKFETLLLNLLYKHCHENRL